MPDYQDDAGNQTIIKMINDDDDDGGDDTHSDLKEKHAGHKSQCARTSKTARIHLSEVSI